MPDTKPMPTDDHDKALYCSACREPTPHRYQPSPDAGPFWRCSECGCTYVGGVDPSLKKVLEYSLTEPVQLKTVDEAQLWSQVVARSGSRNAEHMRNAVAAADQAVQQFRARREWQFAP